MPSFMLTKRDLPAQAAETQATNTVINARLCLRAVVKLITIAYFMPRLQFYQTHS